MIGIVILNYRNWEDTFLCIQSIIQSTKEKFHIYLVDNYSPNKMPNYLEKLIIENSITFIECKENRGYAAGNNAGIKSALKDKCNFILITNNDVRFYDKSILRLKQYLLTHPEVGIVGPKIINEKGDLQKSCICVMTGMKEKYLVRTRANIFFKKQYINYFGLDRDYNKDFEVFAVLGCCFMLSRSCAQDVTPLDENTFLYEEELILGLVMQEKGYKTMYHADSIVQHLHGKSTERVRAFAFTHMICSEIYYCKRYLNASNWEIYPLYWYRNILYLIRCIKYEDFRKNWIVFRKETKKWFAY